MFSFLELFNTEKMRKFRHFKKKKKREKILQKYEFGVLDTY